MKKESRDEVESFVDDHADHWEEPDRNPFEEPGTVRKPSRLMYPMIPLRDGPSTSREIFSLLLPSATFARICAP